MTEGIKMDTHQKTSVKRESCCSMCFFPPAISGSGLLDQPIFSFSPKAARIWMVQPCNHRQLRSRAEARNYRLKKNRLDEAPCLRPLRCFTGSLVGSTQYHRITYTETICIWTYCKKYVCNFSSIRRADGKVITWFAIFTCFFQGCPSCQTSGTGSKNEWSLRSTKVETQQVSCFLRGFPMFFL